MASLWFDRFKRNWALQVAVTDNDEKIRDIDHELANSCNDRAQFGLQVDRLVGRPFTLSVPKAQKRVALVHDLHHDHEQNRIFGMNGFSTSPATIAIKIDDACSPLVGKVSDSIGKTKLPTVHQMLRTYSEKGLLAIEGESSSLVEDFQSNTRTLIWSPQMLKGQESPGEKEASAIKLLCSMINTLQDKETKVLFDDDEEDPHDSGAVETGDEQFASWSTHMQYLWIISKGWNQPIKPLEGENPPPEFRDVVVTAWKDVILESSRNKTPDQEDEKKEDDLGDQKDRGRRSPPSRSRESRGDDRAASRSRSPSWSRSRSRSRSPSEGRRRARSHRRPREDRSRSSSPDSRRRDHKRGRTRKGKRRDKGPPDSPSSGSSSSSDFDSDDSERRNRHRRRKLKKARRATSKKDHNALLRETLWTVALNSSDQLRKDKGRDSMLKTWTDTNKRLFKIISARDYRERGVNRLTSFARKLTKQKGIHRASSLVLEEARTNDWPGDILRGALAGFLAQGFRAHDITCSPGGFTAFMCAPLGFEQSMSKNQLAQRLSETFGDEKLDEGLLKEYSNLRLFLPKTVTEAEQMLEVTVRFLDLLTGYGSIASETYRIGRNYLRRMGRRALQATRSDSTFPTKFLYLLDCVFQNWCDRMARYADYRDPLREARRDDMDRYARQEIRQALSGFERTGYPPQIMLPTILQPKPGTRPQGGLSSEDPHSPPKKEEETTKETKPSEEPWHRENPERQTEWSLPPGKSYNDFFKKGSENLKKLPKLRHHRHGKDSLMCLHYQIKGVCTRGLKCSMAHVPKSKMGPDQFEKIDSAFKDIYSPT